MSLPKVFVTRRIPDAGLDLLQNRASIEIWTERQPPPYKVLQDKIRDIDGLLCLLTDRIDKNLIELGTSLKVISQMAVGYDNIDVAAATARGIPIGNTPGVLTEATADLTWALLMAASRKIVEAERFVREGRWQTWEPMLLLGADVAGATLGIVGFGRIGQAVARRAKGFDMRVLYWNRHRCEIGLERELGVEYASFEQLLEESDFVSIHVALFQETYYLFDRPQFDSMKPSAILINTARGAIVNPDALYDAIHTGKIAGAALDVTEPEPILPDSPLLSLPNLLIVPHIGSASIKTRSQMALMAAQNLIAGLQGECLPNCVNPEVYERKQ
ncbi:D-glycerate dehydrogenase [Candidatus Gracilibacteria bacterium]|nr:D-glycerate dehydrogenase [Candidatus Gracilibacteria bacterium]NJM86964.1 D-glycerate dehydrogenase [Hydrococcus sp. RU_2_2]NJP19002.1 D-glycerate dehydrogenase [Hydrococcus sp. CRU_1_1]